MYIDLAMLHIYSNIKRPDRKRDKWGSLFHPAHNQASSTQNLCNQQTIK